MTTPDELERAVERLEADLAFADETAKKHGGTVYRSMFSVTGIRLLLSERADLLAAVERMRGALEPFALAADNMDGDEPDSLFIYDSPESAMIDYADLRRARAALTTGEGK